MIRIGLLGLGFIGRAHLEAFQGVEGATVVAAATTSSSVPYGIRSYRDPSELIAAHDIDAVVIALPTDLHTKYTLEALSQGKNVLLEKPACRNHGEVQRLVQAQQRSPGLVLMVAHILRHEEAHQRAVQMMTEGELGTPLAVSTRRLSSPPTWSPWLSDPIRSGGALYDLLVHDFDVLNWILGPPKSVHANGVQGPTGGWDLVQVTTRYEGEPTIGYVHGGNLMPIQFPFASEMQILGTKGAVEYRERYEGAQIDGVATKTFMKYSNDATPEVIEIADQDPFVNQAQSFVNAIRDGVVPLGLGIHDAAQAVLIADAAERSLATREEVILKTI